MMGGVEKTPGWVKLELGLVLIVSEESGAGYNHDAAVMISRRNRKGCGPDA